MRPTDEPTPPDRQPRREWQTPRVIHSRLKDTAAKGASNPTPDSHFLSNDYGSIVS
jgi:hypothetical protein